MNESRPCIERCRKRLNRGKLAAALTNLGDVREHKGELTAAQATYREALAIQRSIRDRWGTAFTSAFFAGELCGLVQQHPHCDANTLIVGKQELSPCLLRLFPLKS